MSIGFGIIFFMGWLTVSRSINTTFTKLQHEMIATAGHTGKTIEMLQFSSMNEISNTEINTWLQQYTTDNSNQSIYIVGFDGHVQWSSKSNFIEDELFYHEALSSQKYLYALTNNSPEFSHNAIKEENYELYYPLEINGTPYCIIVHVDHRYFKEAFTLQNFALYATIGVTVIFIIMFVMIFFLNRRATIATEKLHFNKRLAFLGQTSAELAHELKNPLAIMMASVDTLKYTDNDDEHDAICKSISEEIKRVSFTIENILTFSKTQNVPTKPFTPYHIIEKVIHNITQRYNGISITNTITSSLKVTGNVNSFFRILINLIENASKAMEFKGNIDIHCQKSRNNLTISICDNGPGIDKELQPDIFKLFTKKNKGQVGLGLTIVDKLCTAMSWKISLKESHKGFTEFCITIKAGLWENYSS